MLYFRPLPRYSSFILFIKSIFTSPKFSISDEFSLWGTNDSKVYFFPRSRNAIAFLLDLISKTRQTKIRMFLPAVFCWEVSIEFRQTDVEYIYYPINNDFQPSWIDLELLLRDGSSNDILLLVDFFGIKSDHDKARALVNNHKMLLFVDQTHCVFQQALPLTPREFFFFSCYKQFAISKGAILIRKSEASDLSKEVDLCYARLSAEPGMFINDIIWLIKSLLVQLTGRIKYTSNDYFNTFVIDEGSTPDGLPLKGVSAFTFNNLITYKNRELEIKTRINRCIIFYQQITEVLNKYYSCYAINFTNFNSHLFAIQFEHEAEAGLVLETLMQFKLPVTLWPERRYIKIIKDSLLINQAKSIIGKMIFLNVFFENEIPGTPQQIEILKLVENEIKRH